MNRSERRRIAKSSNKRGIGYTRKYTSTRAQKKFEDLQEVKLLKEISQKLAYEQTVAILNEWKDLRDEATSTVISAEYSEVDVIDAEEKYSRADERNLIALDYISEK